jgi:hypothetical protein
MVGMSEVEDVPHSVVVDVKEWVLPDPKLMVSKLDGETPTERKRIWVVDDSLSPYTLYSYLHARFGKPNGFAMTLKHPSSDNLIQWHYTLTCRDKVIDIYGKNTQMEFIVESEGEIRAEDWTAMVANIKGDMRNYAQELKQVRNQLDKYILFVNPYKRVKTIVDKFAARLAALNVHEVSLPENPRTREELETLSERFSKAVETYTEAAALSTSLKMIAPVMAE